MPSARFDYPSVSLSLKGLVKGTRQGLWLGAALALGIHLIGTQVRALDEARKAPTPLTTQFIKRQPRWTKPLEMRKSPEPKRRRVQRAMVSVKAREGRQPPTSPFPASGVIPSMARPNTAVGRVQGGGRTAPEPETLAAEVVGSMAPEDVVDMSLELMDTEALDCGRYQAMVIQDADDKRRISGYLHFLMPWGKSYRTCPVPGFDWQNIIKHGVRRLVGKLNEWSDVKADTKGS